MVRNSRCTSGFKSQRSDASTRDGNNSNQGMPTGGMTSRALNSSQTPNYLI